MHKGPISHVNSDVTNISSRSKKQQVTWLSSRQSHWFRGAELVNRCSRHRMSRAAVGVPDQATAIERIGTLSAVSIRATHHIQSNINRRMMMIRSSRSIGVTLFGLLPRTSATTARNQSQAGTQKHQSGITIQVAQRVGTQMQKNSPKVFVLTNRWADLDNHRTKAGQHYSPCPGRQ